MTTDGTVTTVCDPAAGAGEAALAFARALDFAAHRHCDQRRKGTRGEPYVNHLAEVARLVAEASGGRELDAILAALLHDTLEDTDTSPADLTAAFGPRIAAIVGEVTDDKTQTKAERKRRQIAHAPHASPPAKLVKLADKISNLRSLRTSPPAGWDRRRIDEYIDWSCAVVAGLRGCNPYLERLFDAAVENARAD